MRPATTGLLDAIEERKGWDLPRKGILPLREAGCMSLLEFASTSHPDFSNGHYLQSGLYVSASVLELTVLPASPKGLPVGNLEEAVRSLTRLPAAPAPGAVRAPLPEVRGYEKGWAIQSVSDEGTSVSDGSETRSATVALRCLDADRSLPGNITGKHMTDHGVAEVIRTGERSLSITWTRRAED